MMYKKLLIILGLLIISCSENPSKPINDDAPVIENVRVSQNWNLADSTGMYTIEIKIKDEQGFEDLNSVSVIVENDAGVVQFSDSLYDDGGLNNTTDVLAGDGVFRNVFSVSEISTEAGQYTFHFTVTDKNGNSDSEAIVIVFAFNVAPSIMNISSPDTLYSGSSPKIIAVNVSDNDGDLQNTLVTMDLLFNGSSILAKPYELDNSGNLEVSGDVFAGDSIFSFKLDSTFSVGRNGSYQLQFKAVDEFGDVSTIINKNIFLENSAPVIFDLFAPATMDLPTDSLTTSAALITINVNDQQGLTDIDSVYFNSIKPNGEPASGNPIILNDIGVLGDDAAKDGIYSITIILNYSNLPGTYYFTFYARDRVGNLSNSIQHSLEVQ